MTPSFIGRYAMISPGVLPTISFASLPTARILLSRTETATTDGSLRTIPFPGTKTSTVVVPRSMPSFGENENAMARHCIPPGCFDKSILFFVFLRIYLPPEFFREVLRVVAYVFQVVQVFRWYLFKRFSHARDGQFRVSVAHALRVQPFAKIFQE